MFLYQNINPLHINTKVNFKHKQHKIRRNLLIDFHEHLTWCSIITVLFNQEKYWSSTDILTSLCFCFQHCGVFAYTLFSLSLTFVYRTSFYWCTKLWEITSRLLLKMYILISDIWRCIHNHWWLRMSLTYFVLAKNIKQANKPRSIVFTEKVFYNILFIEVYVYIISFYSE